MNPRVVLSLLAVTLALLPVALPAQDDNRAARQSRRVFARADQNRDGKLSLAEFPAQWRRQFQSIDKNRDGFVDLEEDIAFRRSRSKQQRDRKQQGRQRPRRTKPTHANVRYDRHQRNVLDLYLVGTKEGNDEQRPTPLVVYIHGGGFRAGDKNSINQSLLQKLRSHGVSMAAFNYRFTRTAPYPAQMHDCARALQFIRHHAKQYNIDPKRIAAIGGSAGSGISQWLALHDDLADPDSEDPIARQSTRLVAAVPCNAQSSYDPRFIHALFDTKHVHPALPAFFGMKNDQDIQDKRLHQLFEDSSPINHATADDPPLLFFFSQANKPLPENSTGGQHIHHPKFGIVMKEKLDKLGVECTILFRKDHPRGMPVDKFVAFFLAKFGMKPGAEKRPKR